MESWIWSTLVLCLYGFFKEIRPSEPYLTEYLMGPWQNLTHTQVNSEIYPVWTYSSVAVVLVVFIVTDFLRYKPVIIVQGICYVVSWCLLLWASGVFAMQMAQFVYAIVTASDIAYFTYIYAKVDEHHFKKVTGFTRSARLFGQFLSGLMSQVLVSTRIADYRQLNFISLGCVSVALVIACLLPSVSSSIYFHPRNDQQDGYGTVKPNESVSRQRVWKRIRNDFTESYSNSFQLKWCLWWALSQCIYDQVGNYVQTLWEVIYPSKNHPETTVYNGAVTAANTLLSALVSAGVSVAPVNWTSYGHLTLALVSLLEGAVLLTSALTTNIWVAYVCYALFNCSYDMLITVVSFQVAKQLKRQSYGLVFGCNTFVALLLGTGVTLAIVSKAGFHLNTRLQFILYSGLAFSTGIPFLSFAIHQWFVNETSER